MNSQFVAYYRVSTKAQGQSGLGLDGQRAAVRGYLHTMPSALLAEFTEVESGKTANRPQLIAAMAECRMTGATLLIAKLDRLSRDAHFLLGLQKAGVVFEAVDLPGANNFTVGIMALVAQQEREAISKRTKEALAQSKKKLGGFRANAPLVDSAKGRAAVVANADAHATRIRSLLEEMRGRGLSLRQMVTVLEARSIRTPRAGIWTATAVKRALERAGKLAA